MNKVKEYFEEINKNMYQTINNKTNWINKTK